MATPAAPGTGGSESSGTGQEAARPVIVAYLPGWPQRAATLIAALRVRAVFAVTGDAAGLVPAAGHTQMGLRQHDRSTRPRPETLARQEQGPIADRGRRP
jgi:hypothetical protein